MTLRSELESSATSRWNCPAPSTGVVSTSTCDMRRLPGFYREKGVPYIFDPGQQLPVLTGNDLLAAIEGSFACITNDYELNMICKATGKSEDELVGRTLWLVTTLGADGALVRGADGTETRIPSVPPRQVLDPTGAGDAHRAGLLKGLLHGLAMIVQKAIDMARQMDIPILGLVENYSYFKCPDNNKEYKIFGESHIDAVAQRHGLKVLARLPIDPALAQACDKGAIEDVDQHFMDGALAVISRMVMISSRCTTLNCVAPIPRPAALAALPHLPIPRPVREPLPSGPV